MMIDEHVIHEIVGEIWGSMLGLVVEQVDACEHPVARREVRASVQLTGRWEGAVVIECDEVVAGGFAAAMLGLGDEPADEADVHDVMGELANMVGGNLKAVVGADARLSLPTVVVGAGLDVSVPGSVEQARAVYDTAQGCFSLVVVVRA